MTSSEDKVAPLDGASRFVLPKRPYPDAAGTFTLVKAFNPWENERAHRSRAAVLSLLHNHTSPFDRRSFEPGHMTASALVVSAKCDELLLVYHRRLERWLQPGGHVEPDDRHVIDTARREVLEETGIDLGKLQNSRLVGVDVHEIPATSTEPAHLHHDLTFAFTADPTELSGSEQARWCPIDGLDSYGVDEPLLTSLHRALSTSPPSPASPPDPL